MIKLRTNPDRKLSVGMTADQFWQPDQQTRSAIRRGDKINREYFKRKSIEYQRALIERLESVDEDWWLQ